MGEEGRHAVTRSAPACLLFSVLLFASGASTSAFAAGGAGTASGDDVTEFLFGENGAPASTAADTPVVRGAADFTDVLAEIERGRVAGTRVGTVVVLGLRPASAVVATLQSWLLPHPPDWEALEFQLVSAAARHYQLVEREIPDALRADVEALRSFDSSPQRIAAVNLGLDVDAVLVARASNPWTGGAMHAEVELLAGRAPPTALEVAAEGPVALLTSPGNPRLVGVGAAVAAVIALLAFAMRRLRGSGTVVVRIERRGNADPGVTYNACVATRAPKGEFSGRHILASRLASGDTLSFQGLPARELWVAVRRIERDPKSLQIASNVVIERAVAVESGRATTVAFEFKENLTAVQVSLLRGDASAVTEQSLLAVHGVASSARYLRNGSGTLHLAEGAHVLSVGLADRGFRIPVTIPPKTRVVELKVDVDAVDEAFFVGCRDAVVPFVHGDLGAAADALQAAQLAKPAALLRAEVHRARGELKEAVSALESAGSLREAAALRATTGDAAGTADLLERAGDYAGAARQLRQAGSFAAAARSFARAESWDDALSCARDAGDRALLLEVLERKGDRFDAASVALEIDEKERGIALLQGVTLSDPRYGEACLLLAQLLFDRGEPEIALQKLDEAASVYGSDSALELREQIARQLESKGDVRAALEAYEHIRKRDIRYPGMAEKIEALREQLRQPAAAVAAPPPAADATRLSRSGGRYQIEEEVGRGGMGVVYRALDRNLGRVVALKRLPDNLKEHPTAVKLFLREARSVAVLNHPNVVTLFDAGQDEDGAYYLTMEYLEGQPLNAQLHRRKRFSPGDAARVAVQVMSGLGYAHQAGIVHRDIKPSNLFLTAQGRVKIMDFGLAKMMEEVRKRSSIIAGTPFYMAPEQSLGEAVDARADLYAFGVSLYELLVGDVPFREGDIGYHHRHTPAPDPRERVPAIPAPLAALVLELMAKRPEDRPANAGVVRERLTAIVRSA